MLLRLQADSAEIIDTEYRRIEARCADLVAQMPGADGEFVLHRDRQALLTQDIADAMVLAVPCDFKQRTSREVIHFNVDRR